MDIIPLDIGKLDVINPTGEENEPTERCRCHRILGKGADESLLNRAEFGEQVSNCCL